MIAERLQKLNDRVLNACKRSLRSIHSVKIVAVSKTHSVELIREAIAAGLTQFGENYPQEAAKKQKALSNENIQWHFIGRLQTNKIKDVFGKYALIHSVDRMELLEKLLALAEKTKTQQPILIQVNAANEETKAGFKIDHVPGVVQKIQTQKNLILQGFMTMPPLENQPEKNRVHFAAVRKLAGELKPTVKAPHAVDVFSMGTSADLDVAIEEGATHIRVGTDLFGPRKDPDED